ncbi:MAG: hypothetical protein GY754_25645, partial [bacterium]|nr:hypothetical protein [bacterium]
YDTLAPSTDDTHILKSFFSSLNNDMVYYDDFETLKLFDYDNNELLKWVRDDIGNGVRKALCLDKDSIYNNDPGITMTQLNGLLWKGWTYTSTSGSGTTFRGILNSTDGPIANMARCYSEDNVAKPFRMQINDILNGNNDGDYTNDPDPQGDVFKKMNLAYSNSGDDGDPETIIEAILTNLYLHVMSDYYSPVQKRWAYTPEDGQAYFGDPNKNIQTFMGGILTSLRNALVLDENGLKVGETGSNSQGVEVPGQDIPMLTEFFFMLAGGYGVLDPQNGPGELTLFNCLKSMGSPLGEEDNNGNKTESIKVTLISWLNYSMTVKAIGNNGIYRKSVAENTWVPYATQHDMSAIEILQPGTFQERTGSNFAGDWHGKFAASQGDVRGTGVINTTNWVLTDVALASWEGYGPYTYKGKAPNGSDCKFKNDWYTDWYRIESTYNGNKGPGFARREYEGSSRSQGQYHVYEAVYRPAYTDPGFETLENDSGYTNNKNEKMPKYGYIRFNSENGSYNNNSSVVSNGEANPSSHKVILDCSSREEAIRKNFNWVLNLKKYAFIMPMKASQNELTVKIDICAFAFINCNGVAGISRIKRAGNSISSNGKWGLAKVGNRNLTTAYEQTHEDEKNYFVNAVNEGNDASRLAGVSFEKQDYCIALDYSYYLDSNVWFMEDIAKSMVSMSTEVWNCLGGSPMLPGAVGENLNCLVQLSGVEYQQSDLLANTGNALDKNMEKFGKFYIEYYPDADLITKLGDKKITPAELPPVPRVKGISYPVAFDDDGNTISNEASWETHTGDSKGKFEDLLGILAIVSGTMHEDGTVYKNIGDDKNTTNPSIVAAQTEIDSGDFAYYANEGYRENLNELAQLVISMNETKIASGTSQPEYDVTALINILVDHDPATNTVVPGSRKGPIPTLLKSNYLNINYLAPIKQSIEETIQNIIKTASHNEGKFKLLSPFTPEMDTPAEQQAAVLKEYYVKMGDDFILDAYGNKVVNPEVNWDKPINKIRYLLSDENLDQVERTLDFVKDLSEDKRFVKFLKKGIPALNNYMVVKYMDEHDGVTWDEAQAAAFQVTASDEDIDKFVEFLADFEYKDFISFIKELGLNDLGKIYNFSFDDWDNELDANAFKDNIDELNTKLVKYFGISPKEAFIEGVYILTDDAAQVPDGFEPGEKVYGLGKYVRVDTDENGAPIGDYDVEDSGKYYYYYDIKSRIFSDAASRTVNTDVVKEVIFEGISEYATIRDDENYDDPWYRANLEQSPFMYSFHKYDLRLDWTAKQMNETLLALTDTDFAVGGESAASMQETFGKASNPRTFTTPKSIINTLYGYDGSSYNGINLEERLEYAKYKTIDSIYDDSPVDTLDDDGELNLFGDLLEFQDSDYMAGKEAEKKVSFRTFMTKLVDYLDTKHLNYEYTIGSTTYYETYETVEAANTHKHMINNNIDIMAELLNPDSSNYKIGALFESWVTFVDAADIKVDDLGSVRDAVEALLYDHEANDGSGDYTLMVTKLTKNMPKLLKSFQGKYDRLLEFSLKAFEDDGIGTYMMDTMAADSMYSSSEIIDEFNLLLNQDIFNEYASEDSFWWQMGNLMDDLAALIDEQLVDDDYEYLSSGKSSAVDGLDVYSSTKEIFEY